MTKEVIEGIEIDYSELEAKYAVTRQDSEDTILIIDHLPKVDKAKEEKLLTVLNKNLFGPAKATIVPDSVFMPREAESGISKGYMFLELETPEQANAVLQAANGYRLDKQHVLSALRLSDFDRLLQMNDEYHEPSIEPFEEKEYLKSWLSDPYARDQFVTLAGATVSVFWNCKGTQQPELVHTRSNWADSYVQWSPRGSYLVTFHGPGVMLWGGSNFSRIGKFPHQGVKLASFSHGENLMATWSPVNPTNPTEPNLLVWDVLAGKLVRGFVMDESQGSATTPPKWPLLKFSYDDKYAARVHDEHLHIYEVPSFALLDKKAQKIEGLVDFSWSPVDHSMVHWTKGSEDIPARLSLISIPSKLVLRTKNLFNVNSCQVHWQSRGIYLCVQVERHSKNKKNVFSNLELFRLREKGIPVDCLDFKDPLVAVAFEPDGDRFLAASVLDFKTTINFYTMKAQENGLSIVKPLGCIERKPLNKFLWSPRGDYLLLMGTDSTNASLEFFCANDMTTLANREQFLGTDAAWDPSGRFVASWVSAWRHSSDHGFVIWDMRGEQVARLNVTRLAFFGWRPRPPTLLTAEKQKEIRKNLKNYSSAFEEADLRELSQESSNTAEAKKKLMTLWNEWRRHCRREYETRNAKRKALIGREEEFADEQLTAEMEEWIEEVVEETEEPIEQ